MANWNEPKVYAVKHMDESVLRESRSGGFFSVISDYVLIKKGVVYGCVLTETFEAIHLRTEQYEVRDRMRGSKYIQSKLGDTYLNVKKDLIEERLVLFTGTSCQIAGLRRFLGKEYTKLICVDIVCHGVPSFKVWNAYIKWQEKINNSKVIEVDFRNKSKFGWREHIETLWFENGESVNSRVFTTLFYGHKTMRPSCYKCPYKSVMHPGNITIADYWGIENAAPDFDDNKGTSLVLINDNMGQCIFEDLKDKVIWKETKIEDSMQPPLIEPFKKPKKREKFWKDFSNKEFQYIAKKYGGNGIIGKLKRWVRKVKEVI